MLQVGGMGRPDYYGVFKVRTSTGAYCPRPMFCSMYWAMY